jgi:hypothetical protein
MLDALASSLREHGLEEEARQVLAEPTPRVHVEPEAHPEAAMRIQRKRSKKPTPSKLTPRQASEQAWDELRLRRQH